MSFLLLGLVVLLAVYLITATAASLLVSVSYPAFEARLGASDPGRRARGLFRLGLTPAVSAMAVTLFLALPAWIAHEPRGQDERPGPLVLALAGMGALLLFGRTGSALRGLARTQGLVRRWRARGNEVRGLSLPATRFAYDFPLAGLAGIFRPRLLLAEPLLAALERDELAAVVEHERAHAEAGDNLRRLLLRASPDPFALTTQGARLRAEFEEAAEAAADAAASVRVAPLSLARALLKVAAQVPSGHHLEASLATLHRDGSLAARVRALLEASGQPPKSTARGPRARGLRWLAALGATPALALLLLALLPAAHEVLEALVHAPAWP